METLKTKYRELIETPEIQALQRAKAAVEDQWETGHQFPVDTYRAWAKAAATLLRSSDLTGLLRVAALLSLTESAVYAKEGGRPETDASHLLIGLSGFERCQSDSEKTGKALTETLKCNLNGLFELLFGGPFNSSGQTNYRGGWFDEKEKESFLKALERLKEVPKDSSISKEVWQEWCDTIDMAKVHFDAQPAQKQSEHRAEAIKEAMQRWGITFESESFIAAARSNFEALLTTINEIEAKKSTIPTIEEAKKSTIPTIEEAKIEALKTIEETLKELRDALPTEFPTGFLEGLQTPTVNFGDGRGAYALLKTEGNIVVDTDVWRAAPDALERTISHEVMHFVQRQFKPTYPLLFSYYGFPAEAGLAVPSEFAYLETLLKKWSKRTITDKETNQLLSGLKGMANYTLTTMSTIEFHNTTKDRSEVYEQFLDDAKSLGLTDEQSTRLWDFIQNKPVQNMIYFAAQQSFFAYYYAETGRSATAAFLSLLPKSAGLIPPHWLLESTQPIEINPDAWKNFIARCRT